MGDSLAVQRAEERHPVLLEGLKLALQTAGKARAALEALAERDRNGDVLTAMRYFPAREAIWAEFPEWVNPDLQGAYESKGIARLYSHQAEAAEVVHARKNGVIVTPTASGKTLCYNLPVLNSVLENPDTRALYLFPTKALAQDQLAELYDLTTRLEEAGKRRSEDRPLQEASNADKAAQIGVFTYDGDTPGDARRA